MKNYKEKFEQERLKNQGRLAPREYYIAAMKMGITVESLKKLAEYQGVKYEDIMALVESG